MTLLQLFQQIQQARMQAQIIGAQEGIDTKQLVDKLTLELQDLEVILDLHANITIASLASTLPPFYLAQIAVLSKYNSIFGD
jgi:uncharacterized membrane protein